MRRVDYISMVLSALALTVFLNSCSDDTPDLTIAIDLPSSVAENQTVVCSVTLSEPPVENLAAYLQNSHPGQCSFPPSVVIPAGQTTVNFNLSVGADNLIEMPITANLRVTAAGYSENSRNFNITDATARALTVLLPDTILEGGSNIGMVSLAGGATATFDISVQLESDDEGRLVIPESVVEIPADSNTVEFDFETLADVDIGENSVMVSASASGYTPAFEGGSDYINITE